MRKLKRAYRKNAKKRNNFKQKALTAGAAAAITFGASTAIQKAYANEAPSSEPDKHQIAVDKDYDSDFVKRFRGIRYRLSTF